MRHTTIPFAALALLALPAVAALAAPEPASSDATGIWTGKLDFGQNGTLRVVVTVEKNAAGKTIASLKSPDQSPNAIALDGLTRTGDVVTFRSTVLDASYKGTLNASDTEITGTFTQHGHDYPLVLDKTDKQPGAPGTDLTAAQAAEFGGAWSGPLAVGGNTLHLIFRFTKDDEGKYVSVIDSVDQGNVRIASTFSVSGDVLDVKVPGIGGNYHGTVSADHKSIVGTWTQNGSSLPLTLTKSQ